MKRASLFSFIFITCFVFSAVGFASGSIFTISFDPQDLVFEKAEGYDRVKVVDGRLSREPGNPLLPVKFVQIAIPTDLEVEKVEVVSFQHQELLGTYKIYPAQPPLPLIDLPTKGREISFVPPNPSVYSLSSEYPGVLAQVTNNGFLAGQHIAGVALYPLQYIPSEGKLVLYTRIELKLVFRSTSHFPAPVEKRSERGVSFYSSLVKSIVINPEEVKVETKGFLPQEEEVDYLIITESALVTSFQQLADWKIQKGISAEIKTVSWVTSNYPGYDDQEKIRNCIRDYYANHGTKWVLLGGDTPILPHRMAPVMGEDIPCDLYFSDLDSNWDANGNHVYGEYEDNVDLYPDVFVGRAPSNNVTQAQTFVNKVLTYETNPPTDYQNRILYAAEVVWVGTDAAECKNYIDSSFVPGYFQDTKLYESSGNLTWANFRDGLNQGQNIINHNGHGNSDLISIGSDLWTNQDMDNLVNTPRFSLFYTFACITAAIDVDCLGEHFVNNPNGGGIAYCGNSRYGWGIMGQPLSGPGPEFDIEFFRSLFDSSNYQAGKTLGNSKIPFIPVSSDPMNGDSPYYRWTMFTLLLLGDPTLDLWTNTPVQLSVSHNPVCFAGVNYFEVNVAQNGALVCCVKDGQILGTAYSSGGSAIVYFDAPLITFGNMHVTVTKHDYLPYQDTVLVIPPEGPFVIYHSHQIDDSQGNNNGVINPGESILMPITVKNVGIETAHSVFAKLRENSDHITVSDSVKSFGDIDSGMTAVSVGSYVFQVDPFCPDSHLVKFTLEVNSSESTWNSSFFEMVVKPGFILTTVDTVSLPRGGSTDIKLVLTSIGGFNWQVNLSYSALPPGVSGYLNPTQIIPTDSSILQLSAVPDAPLGVSSILITATGGELTKEKEVVLLVMPPAYYGPVWHVSTIGHDLLGNGSTDFPFRTIQKGINTTNFGDTVLVERGEFFENINFYGKAILVGSRFIFDGLESTIDSTIIDGDSAGSVVTFNSGEDSNSVIRGFTLTRGYATYGGGIYCKGSSPTIMENFLVGNDCPEHRGGPAIYCGFGSNAKIYRNLIYDSDGAAAIFFHMDCHGQVISNTVCDNVWGGLSIQGNSYTLVKNNIFCNNVSYGIHTGSDGTADIAYNNVYGQENDYFGELADQTGINGNISADPFFVDASIGDYHLNPTSPDIEAGDPDDPVPSGGGYRIDMGAFEFPFAGPDFTLNPDPGGVQMDPGDSTSFKLILSSYLGFSLPVDLSYSALPSGASGFLDPNQVIPTDTSILRIYTTPETRNGIYPIMITATGGGITHNRQVILLIGKTARGDVDGNGVIDIGDIIYLINYLFKNGPPPPYLWAADVNCSGAINIGDLVYLINYLFRGGPPPC